MFVWASRWVAGGTASASLGYAAFRPTRLRSAWSRRLALAFRPSIRHGQAHPGGSGRRARKIGRALAAWSWFLVWAAGCRQQAASSQHEIVRGTVESLRADTGQLTIVSTGHAPDGAASPKISCLLTSDAEVYINDMLTSFEAIEIGDTVELIGYPDPNPRAQRFVVCLAHITRNEPVPPEPDLVSPPTQPATQPQETRR